MPGVSANEHVNAIMDLVYGLTAMEAHPVRTVIDVGCGAGFYGKALRESEAFGGFLVGVEVWRPYVDAMEHASFYDLILVEDVRALCRRNAVGGPILHGAFVSLALDVLEHMTKDDAQRVLAFLRTRGPVVVTVPIGPCPQGLINGNPYERHVAEWQVEEMEALGGKLVEQGKITGLFLFERTT